MQNWIYNTAILYTNRMTKFVTMLTDYRTVDIT